MPHVTCEQYNSTVTLPVLSLRSFDLCRFVVHCHLQLVVLTASCYTRLYSNVSRTDAETDQAGPSEHSKSIRAHCSKEMVRISVLESIPNCESVSTIMSCTCLSMHLIYFLNIISVLFFVTCIKESRLREGLMPLKH